MERKYLLKLEGLFAGHGEIFAESEIRYLRDRYLEIKFGLLAVEDFETVAVINKMIKVLEIRTPFED